MQHKEVKVLDTARRIQKFLDSEGAAIGTPVPATLRGQLDAAVTQVTEFQLEQETLSGTVQGHTATQTVMREEIYANFLRPIAKVARFALQDVTELATLIVPPSVSRYADFVAKVGAAADSAAKYEQTFVSHGLPADFIAQLRAALAQMSASKDDRALQVGRASAATAGIGTSIKALRKVIRTLDGVLTPAMRKNKPLLANWVATKRIQATVVTPLPTGDASLTSAEPTTPATESATSATEPPKPAA